MKTIKISDTKLKVILTREDMESSRIGEGELDTASPEVREALRRLLTDAGRSHGVDISSGRLFIQLYEASGGGCEMFVTKLDGKKDADVTQNTEKETERMGFRGTSRAETGERGLATGRFSVGIYEFSELSPMLSACERLGKSELVGQSAAYSEDGDARYFLVLCESGAERLLPELTDAILYEYGAKHRKSGAYAYIKEHCTVICDKDAVKCLGALA